MINQQSIIAHPSSHPSWILYQAPMDPSMMISESRSLSEPGCRSLSYTTDLDPRFQMGISSRSPIYSLLRLIRMLVLLCSTCQISFWPEQKYVCVSNSILHYHHQYCNTSICNGRTGFRPNSSDAGGTQISLRNRNASYVCTGSTTSR